MGAVKRSTTELELTLALPDGEIRRQLLSGLGPFTVGREDDCSIVLKSRAVSRHHATIEVVSHKGKNGLLRVSDFSMNGTRVGSKNLRGATECFELGTQVRVGPFAITVAELGMSYGSAIKDGQSDTASANSIQKRQCSNPKGAAKSPQKMTEKNAAKRRRQAHRELLERLDLQNLSGDMLKDDGIRPKVRDALRDIADEMSDVFANNDEKESFVSDLCDEALGLGPLEKLLCDDSITEIMVVDPQTIFVDSFAGMQRVDASFTDDDAVRSVLERIVTPLGRRIDESSPLVDARLPDGSRVNAVIGPLATRGTCITIRKFPKHALTLADLTKKGSLHPRMKRFLERSVAIRKNIVISGGTGSGKTTLLNALSASIGKQERVVTIEDAAELRLQQSHVVSLETRPANLEGRGAFEIRDLVKNALRMRPDRIVVGECRGGEGSGYASSNEYRTRRIYDNNPCK